MRGIGRVQAAGAGIGNMGCDLAELKVLHKRLGRGAPTVKTEAHHTARAVRHVLLSRLVVLVALEPRIAHKAHLGMALQKAGHGQAVLAMTRHAHVQALERAVEIERRLRVLHGAQIAHELGGRLGDEGTLKAEFLGVDHAVIALVGGGEAREPVGVRHPVELAGIHDSATKIGGVPVHVLSG